MHLRLAVEFLDLFLTSNLFSVTIIIFTLFVPAISDFQHRTNMKRASMSLFLLNTHALVLLN